MHLAFMLLTYGAFYATKRLSKCSLVIQSICKTLLSLHAPIVALFCLVDRPLTFLFSGWPQPFFLTFLSILPNCHRTTTGKQLNTHAPLHKEFLSSGQRFSVPRCKTKRYENRPSFHLQPHWWTSCEKNCTICTKSLSTFYLCIYLLAIHWVLKCSYFVFVFLRILCCSVLNVFFSPAWYLFDILASWLVLKHFTRYADF